MNILEYSHSWLKQVFPIFNESTIKNGNSAYPCIINGRQSLVYQKGLERKNNRAFQYLKFFAEKHGFRLKEDQRSCLVYVKQNRRSKILLIMVFGTSLCVQNAMAVSTNQQTAKYNFQVILKTETTYPNQSVDQSNNDSRQDIKELIDWITDNSSFSNEAIILPRVIRISSQEIINIAFPNLMPEVIN